MSIPRVCFPAFYVLFGAVVPAAAQSVVSTHAGIIHYFEGAVSVGGAPLQPQFGRFPEIADGAELRTAAGRAEVLLGPGVMLRVAEDTAIKMLSSVLTDTRLELLSGAAILEAKDALPGNSVTILYKGWQVRVPEQGVYRIDSNPEQLRVYKGMVEVRTAQGSPVAVNAGQTLPLAAVLVPDETVGPPGDGFNSWSFDRSEAVAADNATASQITDDPALYPDLADASGLAMASYTYFPPTAGVPYSTYGAYGAYAAYTPYLGSYYGYYSYAVRSGYALRPLSPRLPIGTVPPLRLGYPTTGVYHPGVGVPITRPGMVTPSVPHTVPVARPAPHVGHR